MPTTYTLISSNVLSSSAASVTFSSIPATYTDLVLRISARGSGAVIYDGFLIKFNGSTTNIYSNTALRSDGSAADSVRDSNQPFFNLYNQASANSATANTFGSSEIYIPSYTATQNKPVSAFGVGENNLTESYMATLANLYRDTATISSINITPMNSANWLSGSSFYLYGISNA